MGAAAPIPDSPLVAAPRLCGIACPAMRFLLLILGVTGCAALLGHAGRALLLLTRWPAVVFAGYSLLWFPGRRSRRA